MLSDAVDALRSELGVEFHKKLLAASLKSLEDTTNPLSFNNFCTGFRELVRHVLSDLAPDAEIKACGWYTPDKSSRSGITRSQAITYVIQGGLPSEYVTSVLDIDVSEERRTLVAATNQLNKYTHVGVDTFGIAPVQASEKAELAVRALSNVLALAGHCRSELARALEEHIHDEVVGAAISETIGSIDELATHHTIEEIDVEEVTVTKVDSGHVHINASGTIGVGLQWGSNSDLRRGDGATGNDSFPFTCELRSSVESPEKLQVVDDALLVDTSSWWEGYYDEE